MPGPDPVLPDLQAPARTRDHGPDTFLDGEARRDLGDHAATAAAGGEAGLHHPGAGHADDAPTLLADDLAHAGGLALLQARGAAAGAAVHTRGRLDVDVGSLRSLRSGDVGPRLRVADPGRVSL